MSAWQAACTFPEGAGRPPGLGRRSVGRGQTQRWPLHAPGAQHTWEPQPGKSVTGRFGRSQAVLTGKGRGFWEESGPARSPPLPLCPPQPPGRSNEAAPPLQSKGLDWTPLDSKEIQPVILKEIGPEYSLAGLMLKLKLQYFGHLMRRTNSLEKTLMMGKIEGRGGEGDNRG